MPLTLKNSTPKDQIDPSAKKSSLRCKNHLKTHQKCFQDLRLGQTFPRPHFLRYHSIHLPCYYEDSFNLLNKGNYRVTIQTASKHSFHARPLYKFNIHKVSLKYKENNIQNSSSKMISSNGSSSLLYSSLILRSSLGSPTDTTVVAVPGLPWRPTLPAR